jgi:hypothetical protein
MGLRLTGARLTVQSTQCMDSIRSSRPATISAASSRLCRTARYPNRRSTIWCIASLRARFVVGIFDYPATIQPSTPLAMPIAVALCLP